VKSDHRSTTVNFSILKPNIIPDYDALRWAYVKRLKKRDVLIVAESNKLCWDLLTIIFYSMIKEWHK